YQIPEDLKPVYTKIILEKKLTFSLEGILKDIINNEKGFVEFARQFSYLVDYEISDDKMNEIKQLTKKLKHTQIIILLKRIICLLGVYNLNDNLKDLIILLIPLYPHQKIGDIVNEFLIGIQCDKEYIPGNCAKILGILLTEKLLPLTA